VDRSCPDYHHVAIYWSRDVAVPGLLLIHVGWARAARESVCQGAKSEATESAAGKAITHPKPTARRTPRQTDRAIAPAARGELDLIRAKLANEQLPPDPVDGTSPSTLALSRFAAERRPSPLIRSCIAVGGTLAAVGIGTLLLRNSATDPVRAAVIFAKEVWAVAPLRPTARGRLTAPLRMFRGPLLRPSPRYRPPHLSMDAAWQHPLPHPPTDAAWRHPPPHPPTDAAWRHPPPHPPTDAAWRHPPPHPPTDAAWGHPRRTQPRGAVRRARPRNAGDSAGRQDGCPAVTDWLSGCQRKT
jgi:hypothetical protein